MIYRTLFIAVLSLATGFTAAAVHAHEGHNSPVPWQACKDKLLDEPCEYSNAAQDLYRGSCREVNHQLLCVRNQPIVRSCADRNDCTVSATASISTSPAED